MAFTLASFITLTAFPKLPQKLFGLKYFGTPVLKTYWPYAAASVVTFFLLSAGADASANSKEFINDPRNPRFKQGGKIVEV